MGVKLGLLFQLKSIDWGCSTAKCVEDVIGEWRKLHNEYLHNLYSSSSIIKAIKSRRIETASHVARMGI